MQKQKKIKIAVVTGTFPSVSETFVINHVKGLLKAGIHVDFYCLHKDTKALNHTGLDPKVLTVKGLQPKTFVQRLKCIFKTLQQSKYRFLWQTIKTFNIFKYGNEALIAKQFFKAYYLHYFQINSYDVVHIHFATNAVKLLPLLKNFKNKIVVTFHGYDAHKYDKDYYLGLNDINNIRYTVNSNYTKSLVLNLGMKESNIRIVPMPVHPDFLKKHEYARFDKRTFKIIFVGRFIELKAPLLVIKIVHKLQGNSSSQIKLNMIGSGNKVEECSQYIRSNNLQSNVMLKQNLTRSQIIDLLVDSDIFLFPGIKDENGRMEAQGLVIQEAQALGKPVIVSNVGGLPEGLIDGETGFVVREGDIDGILEKITWLINHPKEIAIMGQKARDFIKKKYSREKHIQSLLKMYQDG